MFKQLFPILALILALATPAIAADSPTIELPIELHVIPELGYGVFLADDQVITPAGLPNYFFVRLPGFVFPGLRNTSSGAHIEFSPSKSGPGVQYSISSYTRVPLTETLYTGALIRIAQGTGGTGGFDARATPIVGMKLATFGGRVAMSLEVEFLDNGRPIKSGLVLTWK